MPKEKGLAPLILLLIGAIVILAVVLLIRHGLIQPQVSKIPGLGQQAKEPTVSLQTQYQNPFEGKFVNPFAGYKNPFDALK